jgi:hypothetical protein
LLAVRVLEAFDEVEEDSVFETAGAIGEIDVLCINGLRSNKEILKRMALGSTSITGSGTSPRKGMADEGFVSCK